LAHSLKLSLFPSAGVLTGGTGSATITLQTPPAADMSIQLRAPKGNAQFPASARIPAGSKTVSFPFTGLKSGVEELLAIPPPDMNYETAFARVQVADAAQAKLVAVSGDRQIAGSAGPLPNPIVVRLTDANGLPYPGQGISAAASTGGSVTPADVLTDAQGQAAFRWTVGAAGANQLTLQAVPGLGLTLGVGNAVQVVQSVVNAASFVSGMSPGALGSVGGVNLAGGQRLVSAYPWPAKLGGVQVLLNGAPLQLLFVSDTQVNFYVPQDAALGPGTLTVATPFGSEAEIAVNLDPVQPGIFDGAVLHAGTAVSAITSPVHAGDFIEIYCTGLGKTAIRGGPPAALVTPTVFFGATPVRAAYAGLAPGFVGLYQVNAQVPDGLTPGLVTLLMSVNQAHSNEIKMVQ
jgi:uncharacterized protein (TIGR03437 family)